MLPFTPRRRDNLASWLVARSDGDQYGQLMAFEFPKQKLVFGPRQVVARINQDQVIAPQITLWNQQGSEVIQGTLMVIPIEESLLYVRPMYLRAQAGRIPELTRVIVAYQNSIVMERTLDAGLARLFSPEAVAARKVATEDFQQAADRQRRRAGEGSGRDARRHRRPASPAPGPGAPGRAAARSAARPRRRPPTSAPSPRSAPATGPPTAPRSPGSGRSSSGSAPGRRAESPARGARTARLSRPRGLPSTVLRRARTAARRRVRPASRSATCAADGRAVLEAVAGAAADDPHRRPVGMLVDEEVAGRWCSRTGRRARRRAAPGPAPGSGAPGTRGPRRRRPGRRAARRVSGSIGGPWRSMPTLKPWASRSGMP